MASVSSLNSKIGVGSILPPQDEVLRLPDSRSFVSIGESVSGLEDLFDAQNSEKMLMSALTPKLSNPEDATPGKIQENLDSAIDKLKQVKDPFVRAFCRDVAIPLEENHDLLKAYQMMLVGG